MVSSSRGLFGLIARAALVVSVAALVAACSGAVSGPAPVNDPNRITILPDTAVAFSGTPMTFVISGGTGSYIVSSSNQAVINVAGSLTGNTLTVVPNVVTADTDVTLTVRDSGTTPTASAKVTVKPSTVGNEIAITPSSTQAAACKPAICSGGDALVTAKLSQGGAPLPGRTMRFDVVSGDFRFIVTDPVTRVDTLVTSTTAATDSSGSASARIRILADAANQTALLQVTDADSGSFQRAAFVIAQSTGTSPGFFITPSSIQFQGFFQNECASGSTVSATFFVFGGSPPYTISNTSSAFTVNRDTVSFSGGSFTVFPTGQCVLAPGIAIVVRDAAGHTTTATLTNLPGTQTVPPVSVAPQSVTLSSCSGSASATVAGGRSGSYFVSSGSDAIQAFIFGNTVTISRRNPSAGAAGPLNVGVSDGTTTATITVNLVGSATGPCPTPPLSVSPSNVTLTACQPTNATATISGGSGSYGAIPSVSALTASVSGSTLTISRTPNTTWPGGTQTVSVTDRADPSVSGGFVNVSAIGLAATTTCP